MRSVLISCLLFLAFSTSASSQGMSWSSNANRLTLGVPDTGDVGAMVECQQGNLLLSLAYGGPAQVGRELNVEAYVGVVSVDSFRAMVEDMNVGIFLTANLPSDSPAIRQMVTRHEAVRFVAQGLTARLPRVPDQIAARFKRNCDLN